MVEADSHVKLLPPSILNIYKVFEHIDMLSICIVNWHTVAALNLYTHTPRQHLPLSSRCCPHHTGVGSLQAGVINCACIVTLFYLTSLASLCWHCRPFCADVIALVALLLPLFAVLSTTLPTVHAGSTRVKTPANQLLNASTTWARRPAQQGQ
jgi:hypothetical protein